MSYTYRRGLHGVTGSDSYPNGTLMVGGYQVVGLASAAAAGAVQKLREAFAASFPFGSIPAPAASGPNAGRATAGWGPAFGVPAGTLYAVIATTRDSVTGAEINAAFAAVGRDLSRRLGLVVRNTNAHTLGGAAPLPALTPDPGTPLGPDGAPIISSGTSPLLVGGIVAVGLSLAGLVYAVMRRPVRANAKRRSRR